MTTWQHGKDGSGHGELQTKGADHLRRYLNNIAGARRLASFRERPKAVMEKPQMA